MLLAGLFLFSSAIVTIFIVHWADDVTVPVMGYAQLACVGSVLILITRHLKRVRGPWVTIAIVGSALSIIGILNWALIG